MHAAVKSCKKGAVCNNSIIFTDKVVHGFFLPGVKPEEKATGSDALNAGVSYIEEQC